MLQITVDQASQDAQLPPLTLQTLLDNAINQNVVSVKTPLVVRIRTDDAGHLIVDNTINRKTLRVLPTRNSLANLISQFRLQQLPDPVIIDNEFIFSVTMSLAINRKTNHSFRGQMQLFL